MSEWTVNRLLDKNVSEHATPYNRYFTEVCEDTYLRLGSDLSFKAAKKNRTEEYILSEQFATGCLQIVVNSYNSTNTPYPDKIVKIKDV